MIIKSYEANKATLKEYTIILLYGKNEGLQNETIEKNFIVDFKGAVNKYDENEFINSYETISSEILTKSLFDKKKIFIISRAGEKIRDIDLTIRNFCHLPKVDRIKSYIS